MKAFRWVQSFRNDERGSMAIELVLVVPILTWVLLSTFVYFDVFRTESGTKRAALTVADMFSREQTLIDANYMDGARKLLRALTYGDLDPDLRVTVYTYDETNTRYEVIWSENEGMAPNRTDDSFLTLNTQGRLPILADGGRAILVETRTNYSAPFRIGLGPFTTGTDLGNLTFDTFTVMTPRFLPQICWDRPDPQLDLC